MFGIYARNYMEACGRYQPIKEEPKKEQRKYIGSGEDLLHPEELKHLITPVRCATQEEEACGA